MSIELKAPDFPESVADGTIIRWNRKPGETIRRDEPLAEIETDKVVFEVPAPVDGVLEAIVEDVGSVVNSGQVIGRFGEAAVEAEPAPAPAVVAETEAEAGASAAQAVVAPFVTPSAQRLIEEHQMDVGAIPATGSGNRILKEDVIHVLAGRGEAAATPQPAVPLPVAPPDDKTVAPSQDAVTVDGRPERRVPMTRLRARIAERLLDAQQHAAILTTFNEVNMQAVMDLRRRYRESFEKAHQVKLGFMAFFVKAVVEGLQRFPELNASIDGQDIVYHGYFDIGIAVSSPRGLVVPIVRDADRLSMAATEQQIADYANKAREGTLSLDDITGGTFSITNGGVFGSLLSTPILNPPQSAILGMHAIKERPIAENGQVVIRPMMNLALSYDHRLVDGREAVQFLVAVKEAIEDPARILLGV